MSFDYVEPASLDEALAILDQSRPEARLETHLMAGGTTLVRRLRRREVRPRLVVGIGRLPELGGLSEEADGTLRIGAATTLSALARSAAVSRLAPLLAEVCGRTRSPQIRTLATLGGALCAGSPLAEPALALLALDAAVLLRSSVERRRLPLAELLVGPGRTALRADEILTAILVPGASADRAWAYEGLSRRHAVEPPLVAAAVALELDSDGHCRTARVALGMATPVPIRLHSVERAVEGGRPEGERLRSAAELAVGLELREDVRASAEYRARVIPAIVRRALVRAAEAGRGTREGVAR